MKNRHTVNNRYGYFTGKTVVAKKKYLGVTCGYLVGWKGLYDGRVRNIRAGLYFKTASEAFEFQKRLEAKRTNAFVEFEILKED